MWTEKRIERALSLNYEYCKDPEDDRGTYQFLIGFAMDSLRFIGYSPFYRNARGLIRYDRFSLIMLYSVLLYAGVVVGCAISVHQITHKGESFGIFVRKFLLVAMIAPQIISPPLSWIECGKLQKYMDKWVEFQTEFERATGSTLPRSISKQNFRYAICYSLAGCVVIFYAIPYHLWTFLKWTDLLGYIFSMLGFTTFTFLWHISAIYMDEVAAEFNELFEKETSSGYEAGIVEKYRLLWMKFCAMVHSLTDCSAYQLSVSMTFFMIYSLIVTYNIFFNDTEINDTFWFNFARGLVIFSFWWWNLASFCNYSYKLTNGSTEGTLRNVLRIIKLENLEAEFENDDADAAASAIIDIFMYTLTNYKPELSVSGYYVMNRATLGSMITAMVTYMIVLLQFEFMDENARHENITRL